MHDLLTAIRYEIAAAARERDAYPATTQAHEYHDGRVDGLVWALNRVAEALRFPNRPLG